jgi:hypothetical protein
MFESSPLSIIPTQLTQSPSGYLHEEGADPGSGSATPTPSAPAAAPTPAASAPVAATPATPQAPATPGAPEGHVPSYRLRETREAAQREYQNQLAQREAQYQSEVARYKAQLQALVGVTPSNQDPEVDAVRAQFAKLYPGLSKMEERAEQLQSLLERSGDLEAQTDHYWQTYGRQTMNRLFEHASTTIGSPLTDEAKRTLHSSFIGFVQSSPELQQRYASDPTIVEDFWKTFSTQFIDPVRRTAAAGITQRAAGLPSTPQDVGGTIPAPSAGPKPSNLDDRVALGWAQYQNSAKR